LPRCSAAAPSRVLLFYLSSQLDSLSLTLSLALPSFLACLSLSLCLIFACVCCCFCCSLFLLCSTHSSLQRSPTASSKSPNTIHILDEFVCFTSCDHLSLAACSSRRIRVVSFLLLLLLLSPLPSNKQQPKNV
jgi:hypothetical protein